MKQTSVQQLIDNLETLLNYKVKGEIEEDKPVFEMFQQALELEKQQIVDAYQWGRTDQHSKESKWYNRNAKQYYSETYKTETPQEYTDEDIAAYRQAEIELCVFCRFGNDPCTCGEDGSVDMDYDDYDDVEPF